METIFKYNGNPITFNKDNEVWINATEMSRPFRNKPVKYFLQEDSRYRIVLKLCNRNSLITNEVDISTSLNISQLAEKYPESIKVVKGANNEQGTWFQEDIALEFARWLSPDFAIWCNDHIKELLKYGITATPQVMEKIIDDPDFAISLLKEIKTQREKISILGPKAELADQLLASPEMYSMEQVAKMLFDKYKLGRNILFEKLREKGVLTSKNLPTQNYMNRGYFYVKEDFFGNCVLYVYNKGINKIMKILNIDAYQQKLM